MKNKVLSILFFLLIPATVAISQNWDWAIQTTLINDLKVSQADDNSVYATGVYKDSCRINGVFIPGHPSKKSIIIFKLTSSGVLQWFETIHTYTEQVNSDVEGTNVYVAATFSGAMTGIVSDSSYGNSYFILGLSDAGNLLFYKSEAGTGSKWVNNMVVQNNRIYICGGYSGAGDISGDSLFPSYKNENFFAAYELNGTLSLLKEIIVDSAASTANSIQSDPNGNIYVYGNFLSDVTIGNSDTTFFIDPMTHYPISTILKFDSTGSLLAFNDYVDGWFEGMVNFHETGDYSIRLLVDWGCNHCHTGTIITRVDSLSGMASWRYQEGSTLSSGWTPTPFMKPGDLAVTDNHIYVAGGFMGDHAVNTDSIHGEGMFLFKMDHDGTFTDVITTEGEILATDLSDFKNGAMIVSGRFRDTAIIGSHPLYGSSTDFSGFIAKYSEGPLAIGQSIYTIENICTIYPNPSTGSFNLSFRSPFTGTASLYDLTGKCIYSEKLINNKDKTFIFEKAPGMYLLRLNSYLNTASFPLIIN
ncbi:MAG: T9SS type A sorting domain-containing protein [Bacteroidota bacterium]|nr:T9SS type A sorting domain-containing protein [Bacteroidota bacterium]